MWDEFANVHPFAPEGEQEGYRALVSQLETWLARLAGFDAGRLAPAQRREPGRVRRADGGCGSNHHARGERERDLCYIPVSAHGTNPASAVMAGFKVVIVDCRSNGDIDLDDLQAKLAEHPGRCGAAMITYPSTHGVFEEGITEAVRMIHEAGGQVYMDGANMNALVGLCRPGKFGADVSHFNLHKTFCIPHGGGGPGGRADRGAGPSRPPSSPNREGGQPVASAKNGSAGILPISWVYLRLMGRQGVSDATRYAILSANYLAKRLAKHYPVLYTGADGLVAHEFILDLRAFKKSAGVSEADVAKRLMDFGYHAPDDVVARGGDVDGGADRERVQGRAGIASPGRSSASARRSRGLRRATGRGTTTRWSMRRIPPPRSSPIRGRIPTAARRRLSLWRGSARASYWPPVGRIDSAAGDRHLVCTCPPMEAWHADEDTG